MKKTVSLILTLLLCLSIAAPALAAETSGKCGENVSWSFSSGTLTIEGTGKMDDYASDAASEIDRVRPPWEASVESIWDIAAVVIKDGVTEIGALAFRYYGITSLTIPAGITRIGEGAFCDVSLTDVYYGGDAKQWNQILIENDNAPLVNAKIHFSDGTGADDTPMADGEPESIPVTVNGKTVAWTDAAPFIDANDRTMVPLRAVADAMGLEVNWDAAAREASFTGGGKKIIFPVDSTTARTSEGGTVTMDTAAVIVNDRTYAPIRYLAEYFGYTVDWDAATRTVVIT